MSARNVLQCPRFVAIAAAASDSCDAEGHSNSTDYLYALDDEGRVWMWENGGEYSSYTPGWRGPLDEISQKKKDGLK